MSSQASMAPTIAAPISPNSSSVPLIPSEQDQQQDQQQQQELSPPDAQAEDPKSVKRRFFGLGKKKESVSPSQLTAATTSAPSFTHTPTPGMSFPTSSPRAPTDPKPHALAQPVAVSPLRSPLHSAGIVSSSSPSRLLSSSPRLHSPASSEIFERNVQEQVPLSELGGELSPAHIPAHVMTEDHIPPALGASAQAITSKELNPDDVEIVMSASHQPAAASVLEGAGASQPEHPIVQSPLSHQRSEDSVLAPSLRQSSIITGVGGGGGGAAEEDGASNYGELDPNDVRRLSFISFKDIVQSEHHHLATSGSVLGGGGSVDGSRDALHATGPPSSSMVSDARAASPLRSPRSPTSIHRVSLASGGGGGGGGMSTPPLPGVQINSAAAATNPEQSPVRSVGLGSPASQHGELTIETMRQALRKTASGDLSGGRGNGASIGAGLSPVGDEGLKDFPRSRTNT